MGKYDLVDGQIRHVAGSIKQLECYSPWGESEECYSPWGESELSSGEGTKSKHLTFTSLGIRSSNGTYRNIKYAQANETATSVSNQRSPKFYRQAIEDE